MVEASQLKPSALSSRSIVTHSLSRLSCLCLQLYPDGDNSLYRERMHLHQVIEDLFVSCFRIEDEEDEKYSELPLNKMVKGGKKILGVTDE